MYHRLVLLTLACGGCAQRRLPSDAPPEQCGERIGETLPTIEVSDVTSAAIAATPRLDYTAEALAMGMEGSLTASPKLYDRVAADLSALRAEYSDIGLFYDASPFDWRTFSLTLEDWAHTEARGGSYAEWQELNTRFEAEAKVYAASPIAYVSTPGNYNTPRLVEEYVKLSGVAGGSAEVFVRAPEQGRAWICGERIGDETWYLNLVCRVNQGQDCVAHYFVCQANQPPELSGQWEGDLGNGEPSWVDVSTCP